MITKLGLPHDPLAKHAKGISLWCNGVTVRHIERVRFGCEHRFGFRLNGNLACSGKPSVQEVPNVARGTKYTASCTLGCAASRRPQARLSR